MDKATLLPLFLFVALFFAGCVVREPAPTQAVAADTSGMQAMLLAADRRFAVATETRGLEGWMSYYTSDAARLNMGGSRRDSSVVQGLSAVRRYDASLFSDSAYALRWEPTAAGVFDDGRYGFTTGRSAFVHRADGDTVQTGTYVTLWRREADGSWRVALDTGALDP